MRDGDKKKFVKKGKGVIDPLALEKNSWVCLCSHFTDSQMLVVFTYGRDRRS